MTSCKLMYLVKHVSFETKQFVKQKNQIYYLQQYLTKS